MFIETDLKRIEKIAAEKEDENWEFRAFLSGYQQHNLSFKTFSKTSPHLFSSLCNILRRKIESFQNTLIRDGWRITDDPLRIRYGGVDAYIDLAAEKLIAAEKADQKIAVEVKSFVGDSTTYEFHTAVGQYVNYRILLSKTEPDRALYLAVPSDVYYSFFEGAFAQLIIEQATIKIVVYDTDDEVIEQWIK